MGMASADSTEVSAVFSQRIKEVIECISSPPSCQTGSSDKSPCTHHSDMHIPRVLSLTQDTINNGRHLDVKFRACSRRLDLEREPLAPLLAHANTV